MIETESLQILGGYGAFCFVIILLINWFVGD